MHCSTKKVLIPLGVEQVPAQGLLLVRRTADTHGGGLKLQEVQSGCQGTSLKV